VAKQARCTVSVRKAFVSTIPLPRSRPNEELTHSLWPEKSEQSHEVRTLPNVFVYTFSERQRGDVDYVQNSFEIKADDVTSNAHHFVDFLCG